MSTKFQRVIRALTDSSYRFIKMHERGLTKNLSDEVIIHKKWKAVFGTEIDLEHPKTFNEKLQWLKLHDRNPLYTKLVDKYAVKEYVADTLGEEYVIPTLGVWDNYESIDFDCLPDQFVLKCTHDSASVKIVLDKRDIDHKKFKKYFNKKLAMNYYTLSREWPYKNVKPRIIAEQYLEDKSTKDLRDYKFFCFNGKVNFFKVDFDRITDHHANYYSPEGGLLPFGEVICPPCFDREISFPSEIKKMVEMAEFISKGIPFVRVDFYCVNNTIYFGELTFFPAAGFGAFTPEEWDLKIGQMLELPA